MDEKTQEIGANIFAIRMDGGNGAAMLSQNVREKRRKVRVYAGLTGDPDREFWTHTHARAGNLFRRRHFNSKGHIAAVEMPRHIRAPVLDVRNVNVRFVVVLISSLRSRAYAEPSASSFEKNEIELSNS